MEIIGANFLIGFAAVLDWVLFIVFWLVIIRSVLTWVNADPYNPIVRFLESSTQPLLAPIRRKIKTTFGGIDIAPLILLVGIMFLRIFLVQTLRDFGMQMR